VTSFTTIAEFYRSGGWFMHPILLTGVLIFALALERAWVILRASSWNFGRLRNDLVKHATRGDLQSAASLCRDVASPVGQVARAIVTSGGRTEDELFAAADSEATVVLPPIARRMSYFSLFANVATLLGLLGTIFGLITAFSAVGAADPSQRSSFLAKGISEAMNTTAFGLLVAVPGLLIHGFLLSRVERITERVDEIAVALVRAMAHGAARESAPAAHASTPPAFAGSTTQAAPGGAFAAQSARPSPGVGAAAASGAGRVPTRPR
jgi:biopolymer transport protein ExbB/TolQ